jgi:tetratricopeptide (TPR) repeat protein
LAAFQKHQEATRANAEGRYSESVSLCREALEIDPDFAAAWVRMGWTFRNAGYADSAAAAWRKALEHPERLTETQRLDIEARLAGDPVARLRAYQRRYGETGIATNQYAIAFMSTRRYEDALAVFEEMAEKAPFGLSGLEYWNWASTLIWLGRVEEAEAVASALEGTRRELPSKLWIAVRKVSLRKGDWRAVERVALELASDQATENRWRLIGMRELASVRAARGRVSEAVAARHEVVRTDPQRLDAHLNNLILTIAAELPPESWELTGLYADTTERARWLAGLWAVQMGDTVLAKSYLAALPLRRMGEFDFPTFRDRRVATLHASVAMRRGNVEEAVRLLERVTAQRWGQLARWPLAEAQERLGQLESAAGQYRRIAWPEHGLMRDYGLTYSFAHRKAALLYGRLGQNTEAIEHWQAFLDAFTDPDPEYEWMVEEARAELERLEGER